ncbi:MAG: hypothetical protein U0441_01710 [Polyangiaceae bacterium]
MASSVRWTSLASFILVAAAIGTAACTAGAPQPQGPGANTVNVPPGDTAGPAGAAESTSAPATSAAPTAEAAPQSVITNEPPPGGNVTSNAGPTPAGSDRMQPMIDLMKDKRDGFRKCFDLWGKKNPGQSAKIAFQFFLKVDGTLEKAQMKPDEGDLHAPEVESCMIAYAKTLTYPKSATGKETVYTHRFDFKAK